MKKQPRSRNGSRRWATLNDPPGPGFLATHSLWDWPPCYIALDLRSSRNVISTAFVRSSTSSVISTIAAPALRLPQCLAACEPGLNLAIRARGSKDSRKFELANDRVARLLEVVAMRSQTKLLRVRSGAAKTGSGAVQVNVGRLQQAAYY